MSIQELFVRISWIGQAVAVDSAVQSIGKPEMISEGTHMPTDTSVGKGPQHSPHVGGHQKINGCKLILQGGHCTGHLVDRREGWSAGREGRGRQGERGRKEGEGEGEGEGGERMRNVKG